jgi:hypothetical protein
MTIAGLYSGIVNASDLSRLEGKHGWDYGEKICAGCSNEEFIYVIALRLALCKSYNSVAP